MIEHIEISREHQSFWGVRFFQRIFGRTLYEEYVGFYNATVDEWRALTLLIAVSRAEITATEVHFAVARAEAAALLDPRRGLLTPRATDGASALITIARAITMIFEKSGYHEAAHRTGRLASRIVRFWEKLRDLKRDHERAAKVLRTSR